MRAIVRNINEMSDSRELLESRTRPFITIFLALLGIIIVGALFWTYYGELDITVKAHGIVRPNEKLSTVKNKVIGKVDSVQFKAGQRVLQGQVLFTIASEDLELEKETVTAETKRLDSELASIVHFKEQLIQDGNSFIEGTNDLDYLQDNPVRQRLHYQLKSALQKIKILEYEINQDERLADSIVQGRNLFTETGSEYFNKYREYELNVTKLMFQKQKAAEEFRRAVAIQGETPILKKPLEEITTNLESYLNDSILKLRTGISSNRRQLEELRLSLAKSYVELNEAIQTGQDQIRKLNNRLLELHISKQDRIITAPISGIVNVITDINIGDLLQAGADVMTIVPEHNGVYSVQLMLQNKDIADIRVGDRIKYHFSALPYKEYGELFGYIRKIGADATIDRQSGGSYYTIEADIENRPLYNKKGELGEVKVGMASEAYVITKSEKILFYLLRKIDLKE